MANALHRITTKAVKLLGHPGSLLVVLAYGVFWRVLEPTKFDFHAVATLVAVSMTLLIQRAQNRDTVALQAKLDELVLATDGARNELAGLDEETVDDIAEIRQSGREPL